MKEQTILFEYTAMKGVFVKKPSTRMLAFTITLKDAVIIMQIIGRHAQKLIGVMAAGWRTTDQEYADEIIDRIKFNAKNEILETLPSSTKIGSSNIVLTLKKPSKYVGSRIVFNVDSRLPRGYYFMDIHIKKKDYKPLLVYKLDADIGKLKAMQKLLGTKFAAMTDNKLSASFKMK